MNKKGLRTTSLLALFIAILLISTNLMGDNKSERLAEINEHYSLVNSIEVDYEDESQEDETLSSAFLAQVKQAFRPTKTQYSKSLDLKKMTKLAKLTYRVDAAELFTATVYVDEAGEYMYEIIEKTRFVKAKAVACLMK